MVSAAIAAVAVVGGAVSASQQSKATKDAARIQANAVESAAGINKDQFNIAKQAIERNNEFARQAQKLGTASALGVNALLAPAQIKAFQQGNIGAQQSLIAGLGQQQNALFGRDIDLSGLQAGAVSFDPTAFQSGLPSQFTDLEAQFSARKKADEALNLKSLIANQQARADASRAEDARVAKKEGSTASIAKRIAFDPLGIF